MYTQMDGFLGPTSLNKGPIRQIFLNMVVHTAPFSYENGVKLIRFCVAFTLFR